MRTIVYIASLYKIKTSKIKKYNFLILLCLFNTLYVDSLSAQAPQSPQTPPPAKQGNEWQLALQWSRNGENEKAAVLYASAYEKDPNQILYSQYLEVLLRLKRYKEAEDLVNRQRNADRKKNKNACNSLYLVDLGSIYKAQENTSKANKSFSQSISEYISHSGTGLSLEELANALWQKSGSAQYTLELYLAARKQIGQPSAFAYEISKCYMTLDKIEKMVDESLLFVVSPSFSTASRDFDKTNIRALSPEEIIAQTVANTITGAAQNASTEPDEQALLRVQADWQSLFFRNENSDIATSSQSPTSSQGSNPMLLRIKKTLYTYWQKDPRNKAVGDLLIWVSLKENNYAEAFRIAQSYRTYMGDGGIKTMEIANIAIENQTYGQAEKELENLINISREDFTEVHPKVAQKALMTLLNLHFIKIEQHKITGKEEIEKLKAEYEKLWQEYRQDPSFYPVAGNLARIYAYYTGEGDKAQTLMEEVISNTRIGNIKRAEMKVYYADMLLFMGKNWDAMLLYAQVEKDFKQDAIGFYAKLQSAKLSYFMGEFDWAKSQLDVLKAATAKLIANDAMELSLMIKENNNEDSTYYGLFYVAKADGLVFRHLYSEALPFLDSVLEMPYERQLYDDVHYKKAQIYFQLDSSDLALSALEKVYSVEPGESASIWADDALLQAAEAYAQKGQKQKSMELSLELFTRFPSSLLAPKAKKLYIKLRNETQS